jgi:small subunit ribosomal protein S2
MEVLPKVVIIFDSSFEKAALNESKALDLPVISVVDTNTNPDRIDYPIPGNDDALKSIKLFADLFVKAVLQGNGGKGIKHELKDYSESEVKIKRKEKKSLIEEAQAEVGINTEESKSADKVEVEKKPESDQTLESLKLSTRTVNAITKAKLSVDKLKEMSDSELESIKGLGKKAVEEIKKALK